MVKKYRTGREGEEKTTPESKSTRKEGSRWYNKGGGKRPRTENEFRKGGEREIDKNKEKSAKRKKWGGKNHKKMSTGEKENLESGKRLEGWLKAYGIRTEEAASVKGANDHIKRIRDAKEGGIQVRETERGNRQAERENKKEKEDMEKVKYGKYEFTFKRNLKGVGKGPENLNQIGEERKRKREES